MPSSPEVHDLEIPSSPGELDLEMPEEYSTLTRKQQRKITILMSKVHDDRKYTCP